MKSIQPRTLHNRALYTTAHSTQPRTPHNRALYATVHSIQPRTSTQPHTQHNCTLYTTAHSIQLHTLYNRALNITLQDCTLHTTEYFTSQFTLFFIYNPFFNTKITSLFYQSSNNNKIYLTLSDKIYS